MISFPTGLTEIKAEYGDPTTYIQDGGLVKPEWEGHTLGMLHLPAPLPLGWDHSITVSRVRIHFKLMESLGKVFDKIKADGNWNLILSFDGTYVWRPKRDGDKLSCHSWGIAIDLNASTNRLGDDGDMPPEIIGPFVDEDWEWGGNWQRKDCMHFQAAHGY